MCNFELLPEVCLVFVVFSLSQACDFYFYVYFSLPPSTVKPDWVRKKNSIARPGI